MGSNPTDVELSRFWGVIRSGVEQHMTTKELYRSVYRSAEDNGYTITGNIFKEMNSLRSLAVSMRSAANDFDALKDTDVITNNEISLDINSRSLEERNLAPQYKVTYAETVNNNGEEQTIFRSNIYDGFLPQTKGDLIEDLVQYSTLINMGTGSPLSGDVTDISNISIAEV
jgi:hypothetical protein